jgi:hypothetical protein
MKFRTPKFIVAAHLASDIPGLLAQTDAVVAGIEGHADLFPDHAPVVQGLKDARTALGDKHTETGPLKRAAQMRSPEARTLCNRVVDAARYVETCANNDPENGTAIIAASSFSQRRRTTRTKAPLALKNGLPAGSVIADAKAAKKGTSAFYSWRYSLDGGLTWIEVADTNHHVTTISGLPLLHVVYVQVAITQNNTRGAWSDSVHIVVH